MRYFTLLLLICLTSTIDGRAGELRNRIGAVADIKISGTAQGGVVTLTLIPQYTLPIREVQIATSAGESNNSIATRLLQAVLDSTGAVSIAKPNENKIKVPGFVNGQLSLKSTDAGLIAFPALANPTIAVTPDKKVQFNWAIPANTTYSRIFIWRGDLQGQIVAALPGDATNYTDTLKDFSLDNVDDLPANLKYWIVGWNPGIPSAHVILEVLNPLK